MLQDIKQLIALFAPRCNDRGTMERLRRMIDDRSTWDKSRALFDDIRLKTLKAEKRHDHQAEVQYRFEEVCAKTLYNLTRQPAPFDPDSPYWIVPNALALAKAVEIDVQEVANIVSRT